MRFLIEAFVIHKVSRFDIHGKRLFDNNDKFYFEDNGIRNTLAGGNCEQDIEKVIESVIYQYLIRMGCDVTVGQLQAGERLLWSLKAMTQESPICILGNFYWQTRYENYR